jgi:hypothetical protein
MPGATRPVQGGSYTGPRSEPGGQNSPRAGRVVASVGLYTAQFGQFSQQVDQGDIFDDMAGVASIITVSGSGVDYVSSTVYEEVLDQDSPISHWRLGTDTIAYDRRRLLDLPAVSGPISTSSPLVAGSDLGSTFAGTQRFGLASAANRGLPYQTANWTVEAWINPTTLASTQYAVYRANLILQMSGSTLRADLLDAASGSKIVILKSNAVIGVTYHAVITYDGINLIGYLDGVEVARTPMTGTASDPNNAPTIGSRSDGVVPFTGTIDEVSWYNTALSAERVLAHFQAGSFGDTGSGVISVSGTSVESSSYVDAGTVTGVTSGSGTESYSSVDSSSGTITASGTGVEQASYADISSGTVTVSGTGTDSYSYTDSVSGTVIASGIGTESYSYADSRSGTVTASGSGTESYQVVYVDSGLGTVTASGSGTESNQVAYFDSGSGTVTVSGSGTESYQTASVYSDNGSGTVTASGSGVESYQPTYADIASGTIVSSGSGTESYSNIDSGLGTITSSGTRAESYSYADSGSGTLMRVAQVPTPVFTPIPVPVRLRLLAQALMIELTETLIPARS